MREFLTLKQDSMNVQEYGMKLTKLSHYTLDMVENMRNRMSMFVAGLGCASSKERRASMFSGYMDISMMMVYVK